MTRVHASDGALVGRIRQRAAALSADPGGSEAGDQRLPRRRRQELLRARRASTSPASRAPAVLYAQNYGSNRRPQGASTITQQVAKNFLLTNEVSFDAQDQGGAAGAAHRAHLFEGQDPRALSQRNLSRPRRLRRRGRLAALFRQVGARTHRSRKPPISRRCRRRRTTAAPVRASRDRAIERRNYVLDRLVENGWIKREPTPTRRRRSR